MAARTKVFVDIVTKSDGKEPGSGLKKFAIGAGVAAVAIAGLIKLGKQLEDTYKVQEQAEARLEQTIRATGKAAGFNARELKNMASELQGVTKFGDEATIGAQSLLLTFKNIGGDVFPRALASILDVSEAMGTGLKESSIQLGKALNDPVGGIAALTRVGIQFTQEQKDTIKSMVAMNDVAGAQGIILDELESQFGGVAKAAAATATGVGIQLENSFGDLLETLGQVKAEGLIPFRIELNREIESVNKSIKAHFLRGKALRGEATVIEELVLREIEQEKTEDKLALAKENLIRGEEKLLEVQGQSDATSQLRLRGLTAGVAAAKNNIAALEDELTLRKLGTETAQDAFDAEQTLLDVKLAQFQAVEELNEETEKSNELLDDEADKIKTLQELTDERIESIAAERDGQQARREEMEKFLEVVEEEIELEEELADAVIHVSDVQALRHAEGMIGIGREAKAIEDLTIDYQKLANDGIGAFASSFEASAEAGLSFFNTLKEAGKDAVSAILKGLAQEALARAALALAIPFGVGIPSAALYTAAAATAFAASGLVQSFATGGQFITDGPTLIDGNLAGDNASGQERVTVEPLGGGGGSNNNTGQVMILRIGDRDIKAVVQGWINNRGLHSSRGGAI